MELVSLRWADVCVWIEMVWLPCAVDLGDVQAPDECLFGEVEPKETVEAGARQVELVVVDANLMTVLQVRVSK